MSEISETEIKSMTKEQNYMRGYKDGKSDVLDKIRDEINKLKKVSDGNKVYVGINDVLDIIDKYRARSKE